MIEATSMNPAEQAAEKALASVYNCIEQRKSFLLEAGAGAGKTYSLIKALRYLIDKQGDLLLRRHQQVACITYTNVATDEIKSRTDGHPAILSSTIHAFCWSLIKNFQPHLREKLPQLSQWTEKLSEAGGIGTQKIDYDLGYRTIKEEHIFLGHDDILSLTVALMEQAKFRNLFTARYPILLIDEYQDTNKEFANALKTYFISTGEGPLIGFFGDHWQKIYGDGCGKIEHPALEVIGKEANFRSVPVIVNVLNRMRIELPQEVKDPNAEGFVAVYHTNGWTGERLTGQHWLGDLPPDVADKHFDALKERLSTEGWCFEADKTKILMLTHRALAAKQGYSSFVDIFQYNDAFLKKEDPHIAFLVDTLEPVCTAYENKRFGEMFAALGRRTPAIQSYADKMSWAEDMNTLLKLRSMETIGAVLDHLRITKRPRLPDAVERKEQKIGQRVEDLEPDEQSSIEQLRKLRDIHYQEVIALDRFIDGHTPFSTKHGVKGAEFENVLVIIGRGWNQYNFNQFLEWAEGTIPSNKRDAFERNRNLFYVVCSRPKKRLALLFTQKLSNQAIATLTKWFGKSNIHDTF
ncbi:ATP-dependent helicase [Patescibacteria group bacterium]|nr:ATP-dependent helicase [Patescibacteria group bacterium]MBU1956743.1 ATP-dependent helicase [Patescibacteria group bacterium]